MRSIVLKPRRSKTELERLARELLVTGVETGDDEVLDTAIYIAVHDWQSLPQQVEFICGTTGQRIQPELAWRLRSERGIDLRGHDLTMPEDK